MPWWSVDRPRFCTIVPGPCLNSLIRCVDKQRVATHSGQRFQVNGLAEFTVIEDLTKSGAEEGHFLLFIWEDLGSPSKARPGVEENTWSRIMSIYR